MKRALKKMKIPKMRPRTMKLGRKGDERTALMFGLGVVLVLLVAGWALMRNGRKDEHPEGER